MSSATYILVQPDLSGWGFITTIEENGKAIRRGHRNRGELADYCRLHNLPVEVQGEVPQWVAQTTSKLERAGISVLTPAQVERGEYLDAVLGTPLSGWRQRTD